MRGEAAVSLLLFQLEKLLKAQSCFPKNTFPSLYTRAIYDFQIVKYGKKLKTSILLSRIKASFRNRLLYQVYHLSASHKCVKGENPSLLVPVLQTSPWRGWMGTGNLFCLPRWVTVVGRVRCLGCWLGAGSTFMLINERSKSHIWHLQWREHQQVCLTFLGTSFPRFEI